MEEQGLATRTPVTLNKARARRGFAWGTAEGGTTGGVLGLYRTTGEGGPETTMP